MTIIAYATNPRMRNAFNLLIVNLAVTDVVISVVILPIIVNSKYFVLSLACKHKLFYSTAVEKMIRQFKSSNLDFQHDSLKSSQATTKRTFYFLTVSVTLWRLASRSNFSDFLFYFSDCH